MKLLIAFLMIFLYICAPLHISANVVFCNASVSQVEQIFSTENTAADVLSRSAPDALNTHFQRISSLHFNHDFCKYFTVEARAPVSVASINNIFLRPPFHYFKSIGLILIFPEHYFF